MKKENNNIANNGLTAVLMVNAVVFSLIAFNKKYKPFLDKMADQYTKLKKDNKKSRRKTVEYKIAAEKIFTDAKKGLGTLKDFAQETLENYTVLDINKMKVLSDEVLKFLSIKLEQVEKGEFFPKGFQSSSLLEHSDIKGIEISTKTPKEILEVATQPVIPIMPLDWSESFLPYDFPMPILATSGGAISIPRTRDKNIAINPPLPTFPAFNSKWFERSAIFLALIIALNSFGIQGAIGNTIEITSSIMEDLEEFFTPAEELEMDLTNYSNSLVHSTLPANQKVKEILSLGLPYSEKFDDILAIEGISLDEKMDSILHSNVTSYENVFCYFLENPQISFDCAMQKIIHSGITNYFNIFEFIMNMKDVSMDTKMYYIIHSELTTTDTIFSFVLSLDSLKLYEKMDYIVHSGIASYEELFNFVHSMQDLSFDEKVWYSFSIPNSSFDKVFLDLLAREEATQEQIVKSVIKADIAPIRTLFNTILKLDGMNKEVLTKYLSFYNSDYNDSTLEAIGRYVFEIDFLNPQEKIDCVWDLMSSYTLEEREQMLLNYFQTDYKGYLQLLRIRPAKLTESQKLLMEFYEKVFEVKEEFVLETFFHSNKSQLEDTICGCSAEGCFHYDDLYGVANVFFNRITHPYYVGKYGTNPYDQFVAPLQFSVYENGDYKLYLHSSKFLYSSKYAVARAAFLDMFYASYEGIKHNYVEFRSSNTVDFSNNIIVPGGNRYGVIMSDAIRMKNDNFVNKQIDDREITYAYEYKIEKLH